jgi:hypothetical protein
MMTLGLAFVLEVIRCATEGYRRMSSVYAPLKPLFGRG